MGSPDHARTERTALCDLFAAVGPDAPTLCEGWTTRDLAAHLIVRERRPDAGLGILWSRLAAHGERVRLDVASRAWPDLIDKVREGPPIWNPMRIEAIDRVANTLEFLVHHEDVRRAAPDWSPRVLDPDLEAQLWKVMRRMSKLTLRKAPVGVVLALPDGESVTSKADDPSVTISGTAGELALFTSGRQAHAVVDLDGPPEAAEALRTADFGL